MSKQVLVVRLPEPAGLDYREVRDYIIESIQRGVLAIGQNTTYQVEDLPDLVGVIVTPEPTRSGNLTTFHISQETPEETVPESDTKQEPDLGEVKRRIRDRLQRYRDANGLGCLEAVAKRTRTRGRINDGTLRSLLIGSSTLTITDWRRIDAALTSLGWEVPDGESS